MTRRSVLPWAVLGVVLLVALFVGRETVDDRSPEEQARDIAATIECPQCSGQSSASSDAPAAVAIRRDVAERLAKGQDADEIRDYYASRFGESILLTPSGTGTGGLVWSVPVIAVVLAFGFLALAFRRWQAEPSLQASEDDRELVAAARDTHGEGSGR